MDTVPAFASTRCQEMQKPVVGADAILVPGSPETSAITVRMGKRDGDEQMPQIATDQIDATGLAAVEAWIRSLPAETCP